MGGGGEGGAASNMLRFLQPASLLIRAHQIANGSLLRSLEDLNCAEVDRSNAVHAC